MPSSGFQVIWELPEIVCMIMYLCAFIPLQFSEVSVTLENLCTLQSRRKKVGMWINFNKSFKKSSDHIKFIGASFIQLESHHSSQARSLILSPTPEE